MNKDLTRADLLVTNTKVYNSYTKTFNERDVYIRDGKFLYIDEKKTGEITADNIIDGKGRYMIPGLIDIHMHIESSLVTPAAFADYTVSNGLTTIVSEPHEIANVCGVRGIKAMIESGRNAPYDIYYAIPSNVPIMGPEFETAGAEISCEDMLELKDTDGVICLGEVMNYKQVIEKDDTSEVGRFIDIVHTQDPYYIIEGHCPQLKDNELARFLYLGINSDHCDHDLEEIRQRFENGMFVQIQDLMLDQEIIDYIINNNMYEYFSFVTDDTFPDILLHQGHLDNVVRKAIRMGMKPEMAIYSATYTPARRMNLTDRGVIAPGKLADFILIDDPYSLNILETYKRGSKVFDKALYHPKEDNYSLGEDFTNTIKISKPDLNLFGIHIPGADRRIKVRIMQVNRNSNVNLPLFVEMEVKDNLLQWHDTGCLLTVVMERHGRNGHVSYGFCTGDCLKSGAAASSLTHDSHNIIVMGENEEDMLKALETIVESHGGIAAVENGKVTGHMALPVAGLMSEGSVEKAGQDFTLLRQAFEKQGYVHRNSVMNFCLLSLTCVPALKLTDCGYMDTEHLRMVPLYEEL